MSLGYYFQRKMKIGCWTLTWACMLKYCIWIFSTFLLNDDAYFVLDRFPRTSGKQDWHSLADILRFFFGERCVAQYRSGTTRAQIFCLLLSPICWKRAMLNLQGMFTWVLVLSYFLTFLYKRLSFPIFLPFRSTISRNWWDSVKGKNGNYFCIAEHKGDFSGRV